MIIDALCKRTKKKLPVAKNGICHIERHLYEIQDIYVQSGTLGGERPIGPPFLQHQAALKTVFLRLGMVTFLKTFDQPLQTFILRRL